ncbi:MAG TPA: hypothetical protein VF042_01290 [Gemmatimonadaceae bacterium]
MKKWAKRLRGVFGMGLTWAALWAAFGIMIGVSSRLFPSLPWNLFFDVFDAPLPALAIPGFIGGTLFSIVLGIAGRRHKFSELSVPQFAAWGAFGGMMLSLIPATMVAVGLAHLGDPETGRGVWDLTAMISVPLVFLCTLSATVSLMIARRAEDSSPSEHDDPPRELGEGSAPDVIIRRAAADRR